ncbi:hypothetical protein Aglo03_22420 [Actinokineospora globicatena]|uniref:Uncharacterized protein n=1 Tax=Actinokineospora globicatena TaxID=103729 RepID=A0A9W6QHZ1_9PSEU|nr:hypothetical protein Aglo03_22420 [Actinokineospora globicatena]
MGRRNSELIRTTEIRCVDAVFFGGYQRLDLAVSLEVTARLYDLDNLCSSRELPQSAGRVDTGLALGDGW